MEWIWLKMFGSLALIVGLIIVTLYILKRFMAFGRLPSASGIAMELAGTLHLGPRRSVTAVKTGGHVILLGISEHGVTFLTQLPEASFAPAGDPSARGMADPISAVASPFLAMLVERFKNGATLPTAPMTVSEAPIAAITAIKKAGKSSAPRKKVQAQ